MTHSSAGCYYYWLYLPSPACPPVRPPVRPLPAPARLPASLSLSLTPLRQVIGEAEAFALLLLLPLLLKPANLACIGKRINRGSRNLNSAVIRLNSYYGVKSHQVKTLVCVCRLLSPQPNSEKAEVPILGHHTLCSSRHPSCHHLTLVRSFLLYEVNSWSSFHKCFFLYQNKYSSTATQK